MFLPENMLPSPGKELEHQDEVEEIMSNLFFTSGDGKSKAWSSTEHVQ